MGLLRVWLAPVLAPALAMSVGAVGCSSGGEHAGGRSTRPARAVPARSTSPSPAVPARPRASSLAAIHPSSAPRRPGAAVMTFDPANTSNAFVSASGATVVFGAKQNVDGHSRWHVIVRSVRRNQFSRADISPDGHLANADAQAVGLSGDGRHVLFVTAATNFGVGGNGHLFELYERDLERHQTVLVSVTAGGTPFSQHSRYGYQFSGLSAHGGYVAFSFLGSHAGDEPEIWLRDLRARQTVLVSKARNGQPGNGPSGPVAVAPDGSRVVFASTATDLIDNDTNAQPDIFLWSRATGDITRLSLDQGGKQLSQGSDSAHFTTDGMHIVYSSDAQLTADACRPDESPQGSAYGRNTYVLDLATGSIQHPKQSCVDGPASEFGAVGSDNGGTVAVGRDFDAEATYLAVRANGRDRRLSYESTPTSITTTGRYVGINHYNSDPTTGAPAGPRTGALIWDLTHSQPAAAWLVNTLL
jgi:hypothetical protein